MSVHERCLEKSNCNLYFQDFKELYISMLPILVRIKADKTSFLFFLSMLMCNDCTVCVTQNFISGSLMECTILINHLEVESAYRVNPQSTL